MINPKSLQNLNNRRGRPKGSKSKTTLKREDLLKHFLRAIEKHGVDKFFDDWMKDAQGKKELRNATISLIPKENKLDIDANVKVEVTSFADPVKPEEPVKEVTPELININENNKLE